MVYIREDQDLGKISLEDYVDYVEGCVDTDDFESLCESAYKLRALASGRDFVLESYHAELKNRLSGNGSNGSSPQSTLLHLGRSFFVRAVIWPAQKFKSGVKEVSPFAYDVAHNHNFHFCTVGYFGPGYDTRILRCERPPIGEIDEKVELTDDRHETLSPGRVMAYEAVKDIHTQDAPESLSISLNLIALNSFSETSPQLIFDIDQRTVTGSAGDGIGKRLYLINIFRHFYDANTLDLLGDISARPGCPRTQAAALLVLKDIAPYEFDKKFSHVTDEVRGLCGLKLAAGDSFYSSGFERAESDRWKQTN